MPEFTEENAYRMDIILGGTWSTYEDGWRAWKQAEHDGFVYVHRHATDPAVVWLQPGPKVIEMGRQRGFSGLEMLKLCVVLFWEREKAREQTT